MNNPKTFEDMHSEIDLLLERRKSKWKLWSISWLDYDDVKQLIKLHIFKKWHLWDQSRPLGPWINRIVSNQMRNLIRNTYTTYTKPCYFCPFNLGISSLDIPQFNNSSEEGCGLTSSKTQCSECPLYAKWETQKKNAFNLKLPVSLDVHYNFYSSLIDTAEFDLKKGEEKLHRLMKEKLSDHHFFIYKMFFIDHLTDEQVAKFLNFKTTEKGRKPGYKQIKNLKKLLYSVAKKVVIENDVFIND